MELSEMMNRTFRYQKDIFDSVFNTMLILEGNAEELTANICEKHLGLKESMKMFEPVIIEYKNMRDNVKKRVDDIFSNFESLFAQA